MAQHSKNVAHELHEYLRDQSHWKTIARWLLIGLVVLFLVAWFGKDIVDEIEIAETWIEGHGMVGWLVFVGLIVAATSIFVPLSLMAIAGGAMFGVAGGSVLTFAGVVLTAIFNYLVARNLFQSRIESILASYPKMRAIQAAVFRQGLRFQLLLRLSPISPVSVSYVLGATGVQFSTFLLATAGLLPAVIMNVYFGYTASHVSKVAGKASEHSTLHTVATVVGLIVCVAVMIAITKIATKAVTDAQNDDS